MQTPSPIHLRPPFGKQHETWRSLLYVLHGILYQGIIDAIFYFVRNCPETGPNKMESDQPIETKDNLRAMPLKTHHRWWWIIYPYIATRQIHRTMFDVIRQMWLLLIVCVIPRCGIPSVQLTVLYRFDVSIYAIQSIAIFYLRNYL